MITRKVSLFKKQIEFFSLTDSMAHFDAGIGMGKTTILGFILGCLLQKHPKSKWILAARDHKQLRNATSVEFDWVLENWLGLVENLHYTKVWSPQLTYKFYNGAIVHGFGAHNYDTVFRGGNYWGLFADEVDYWKPEAWSAAKGRIRKGAEIIRSVSSPKGYNHIWEDYYQNKLGPVITATTYDNPTLSDAYVDRLKKSYSPRLFEQEVLGKRLQINVGAVYNEFDRSIHVKPCRHLLESNDEIFFFTDYNIAHYCGCYMIKKDGIVYVLGEEHLEYKGTREMAVAVKAKFPEYPKIVLGDSTGNNKKDVASDNTNYAIFQAEGVPTKRFRNPPIQSRIINANSRLHHGLVVVDPSCKNLIRDLELVAWKPDGGEIDKKDITLTHASDAFGYGLWYHLPLQTKTNAKITSIYK